MEKRRQVRVKRTIYSNVFICIHVIERVFVVWPTLWSANVWRFVGCAVATRHSVYIVSVRVQGDEYKHK